MSLIASTAAAMQADTDDPLAVARAALEAGDAAAAEDAAERAVAARPDDGEARLVLGMARFRAGHYHEALATFDAALRAERPADAATVEFDRGAVLFKLGLYAEAERAFTASAGADARLAAVAWLNAGLAALEAGDVGRAEAAASQAAAQPRSDELAAPLADLRREIGAARELQARAAARLARAEARRALAAGRTAEAVTRYRDILRDAEAAGRPAGERAELAYALGTAEMADGRPAAARAHFEAAAALAPREGEFSFMAAESALRLDDRPLARARFEQALVSGLDPETTRNARAALDALSPGLRGRGRGLSLDLAASGGYDSNAAQAGIAGIGRTEVVGISGGSGFLEASLDMAFRFALARHLFGELAYGFDQLAYLKSALDPFDLQQQQLGATIEARLGPWARASLMVGGEYLWTGLEHYRSFQRTLVVRPSLAIDEGERVSTSLTAERDRKDILDPTYYYLAGTRTDVTLRQDVGRRRAHVDLSYRYRVEDLPDAELIPLASFPRPFAILSQCRTDACQYVIPYAYRSQAALGHLDLELPGDLLLSLSASVEDRPYSRASVIEPTAFHAKVRHDRRYGAGAALAIGSSVHPLTLRYDLLVNRSNVDDSRTILDYDNKNFTKHVVSLELAYGRLWGWQ